MLYRSNAPQVRLVNGQIVLDVDSLTVERQNEYEELDTSAMEVVEESTMSRKVNSRTHGKYVQSARWSPLETESFYDVRKRRDKGLYEYKTTLM